MGRKARRKRSNSHEDSNGSGDEVSDDGGDLDTTCTVIKGTEQNANLSFAERRELQRKQAAEKRKAKQKCYLCGKSGHVRRQCPGIADDGRGMSRYKGKSDLASEKQKYQSKKNQRHQNHSKGSSIHDSSNTEDALEYPEFFQTQAKHCSYIDVHCDVPATIDYLRTGRGKSKISLKDAIEEYCTSIKDAVEKTNLRGMVSKTKLQKPGRPWINPISFELEVPIKFVLGLSAEHWSCSNEEEKEQATNELLQTLGENEEIIGFIASIDHTEDTLAQKNQTKENQKHRFRSICKAAGISKLPLQIQVQPGAMGLKEGSIAGTSYASALLDLQDMLVQSTNEFSDLRVHLVNWCGKADHAMSLLKAFPKNIHAIGLDGTVTFHKSTHIHECAFELPLDKLVLETSTTIPSRVANSMGRSAFFHSGLWPFLAESVADYKKFTPLEDLVRQTASNSFGMYPQFSDTLSSEEEEADEGGDEAVQKFFVYGTLRENGSNRHVVADVIQETTKGCWIHGSLFHYSPEGKRGTFPYASEKGEDKIFGEVLSVVDWESALRDLDKLESYPEFYYRKAQTINLPDGSTEKAWVYFMQSDRHCPGDPIPSGDWIMDVQS